jgi:hypothetical protein
MMAGLLGSSTSDTMCPPHALGCDWLGPDVRADERLSRGALARLFADLRGDAILCACAVFLFRLSGEGTVDRECHLEWLQSDHDESPDETRGEQAFTGFRSAYIDMGQLRCS